MEAANDRDKMIVSHATWIDVTFFSASSDSK